MQKFRRWTDEATGINPFIQVKPKKRNIVIRIVMSIFAVIKLFFWSPLRYFILICMAISIIIPMQAVKKYIIELPVKILLYLLSVYQKDDFSFVRTVNREARNKQTNIILSNSSSILDTFYYLSTVSPTVFILTHKYEIPDEKGDQFAYEILTFFRLLYRVTTEKQPFFIFHKNEKKPEQQPKNQRSLKQTIEQAKKRRQNIVLFYEAIRTNGLGTIRPSKMLVQRLFELEQNLVFSHLRVSSQTQINSLINRPFVVIFRMMRSRSISLRVRGKICLFQKVNSKSELLIELQEFIKANSSKLLQTVPESYFDFLEYYQQNKN